MPGARTKPVVWMTLLIVALLVAGTVTWLSLNPAAQFDGTDELSPEAVLALVKQKNVGLAALENLPNDDQADGSQSVEAFTRITKQAPAERLGHRNLAVTRLLMFSSLNESQEPPETLQGAYRRAAEALETLREIEGDTAEVYLLAANLARETLEKNMTDNRKPMVQSYRQAAEKRPEDSLIWSELFLNLRQSPDPQWRDQAEDALQKAYRDRPENLVLLTEQLKHQTRQQDPEIVATLDKAETLLRPFAESIRQRGADLAELIEQAQAAARNGHWQRLPNGNGPAVTVLGQINVLANLVKPELAYQQDLERLERHPLEYVIHDFSDEFYAQAELPEPEAPSDIPVRLEPASDGRQFPPLDDVRDSLVADFNLDGHWDVIVLREKRLEAYGWNEDAGEWQLLAGSEVPPGMDSVSAADLDQDYQENFASGQKAVQRGADAEGAGAAPTGRSAGCQDSDVDLVVHGPGGVRLLRNRIDKETLARSLEVIPGGKSGIETVKNVTAVGIADLDHEGDLDLVISGEQGLSLWANRGNWTFAEITDRSSSPPGDRPVTDIRPVDFNRDVAIDLLLTGPGFEEAGRLENLRHGRFRWQPHGDGFESLAGATSLGLAEVDGNASWDVLAGGESGVSLVRTRTRSGHVVRALQSETVTETPVTGLKTWDYDNDGHTDLLAWNEDGLHIFRGLPEGRFEEVPDLLVSPPQGIQTCDVGDLDGDGDLDLLVVDNGHLQWYVNEGGNENGWIDVALRAEEAAKNPSQRSNMHGIGSLIELKAGSGYQARVVSRQSTHFGLGRRNRADVLRVLWTNGIPQNVIRPETGQAVCQKQRLLTGSCPYLYTWTGERFEFFTDCLWAAPIGLQAAEGVPVPYRAWEYLRIPGEKLVPRDGEYVLQITEELWEAAYFDEVKLLAVDHPAGVEVYSNEKVGPPEIAEFQVHTVRNPRTPVAARAGKRRGGAVPRLSEPRDVLDVIAQRDDRYLKAFDRRFKQGLAEEHVIELDLGALDDPQQITLFLTGWIFPTDVNVNIAISQNPELELPQPPSLWVPDGEGGWDEAVAETGFPGGKTKTIAVPVSGEAFPDGDYRLRLVTNRELYWDRIFFTVDETSAPIRITEMAAHSADLHYRGFSRRIEHPGHGPEDYDYDDVSEAPRWPPMDGRFTRYGNVTELLRDSDDLQVVMGAGDEMTVRFQVPDEPPPEGWKRDFLLHNVGWDKDANLNTVYGQTAEPLPFHGMQEYPYPPGVSFPDTPRHREYLKTYQTRTQDWGRFWKGPQ